LAHARTPVLNLAQTRARWPTRSRFAWSARDNVLRRISATETCASKAGSRSSASQVTSARRDGGRCPQGLSPSGEAGRAVRRRRRSCGCARSASTPRSRRSREGPEREGRRGNARVRVGRKRHDGLQLLTRLDATLVQSSEAPHAPANGRFRAPESWRHAGLYALTVAPWAPYFRAFRRVSSNFERMYVSIRVPCSTRSKPCRSSISPYSASSRAPAIQPVHRSILRLPSSETGCLIVTSANWIRPPGLRTL
jgi:hypothetical protein